MVQLSRSLGLMVVRHKQLSHESIQCAHSHGEEIDKLSGLLVPLKVTLFTQTHDIRNMKAHRRTTEKGSFGNEERGQRKPLAVGWHKRIQALITKSELGI